MYPSSLCAAWKKSINDEDGQDIPRSVLQILATHSTEHLKCEQQDQGTEHEAILPVTGFVTFNLIEICLQLWTLFLGYPQCNSQTAKGEIYIGTE